MEKVDVIGNDFGFLFSKEFSRVPNIGESISVSCSAGNCNVYQVEDVCWTVNKLAESAVAVITINTASTDEWIALIMQDVSEVATEELTNPMYNPAKFVQSGFVTHLLARDSLKTSTNCLKTSTNSELHQAFNKPRVVTVNEKEDRDDNPKMAELARVGEEKDLLKRFFVSLRSIGFETKAPQDNIELTLADFQDMLRHDMSKEDLAEVLQFVLKHSVTK